MKAIAAFLKGRGWRCLWGVWWYKPHPWFAENNRTPQPWGGDELFNLMNAYDKERRENGIVRFEDEHGNLMLFEDL